MTGGKEPNRRGPPFRAGGRNGVSPGVLQLGLSGLPRVTLLAVTLCFSALPVSAVGSGLSAATCHPLMLTSECRAYMAQMAKAATPRARDGIQARYERLLREREESCPCDLGHDWIRISPARPGPSLRTLSKRTRT
jgi:hypothetical protein